MDRKMKPQQTYKRYQEILEKAGYGAKSMLASLRKIKEDPNNENILLDEEVQTTQMLIDVLEDILVPRCACIMLSASKRLETLDDEDRNALT